jgi:hypothetical protein
MSNHETQERVADLVIGKRLQTADISHQTAPNPITGRSASDAFFSVAYATEEI